MEEYPTQEEMWSVSLKNMAEKLGINLEQITASLGFPAAFLNPDHDVIMNDTGEETLPIKLDQKEVFSSKKQNKGKQKVSPISIPVTQIRDQIRHFVILMASLIKFMKELKTFNESAIAEFEKEHFNAKSILSNIGRAGKHALGGYLITLSIMSDFLCKKMDEHSKRFEISKNNSSKNKFELLDI